MISRSGDEAVVALCDQWFLYYGLQEWKEITQKALSQLSVSDEVSCCGVCKHDFYRHIVYEDTVHTLSMWMCHASCQLSRSFYFSMNPTATYAVPYGLWNNKGTLPCFLSRFVYSPFFQWTLNFTHLLPSWNLVIK